MTGNCIQFVVPQRRRDHRANWRVALVRRVVAENSLKHEIRRIGLEASSQLLMREVLQGGATAGRAGRKYCEPCKLPDSARASRIHLRGLWRGKLYAERIGP